jgi:hypothetical protein
MILANIEPGETGYDVRTFECPRCRRFQQYVVESNVSETWLSPGRIKFVAKTRIETTPTSQCKPDRNRSAPWRQIEVDPGAVRDGF